MVPNAEWLPFPLEDGELLGGKDTAFCLYWKKSISFEANTSLNFSLILEGRWNQFIFQLFFWDQQINRKVSKEAFDWTNNCLEIHIVQLLYYIQKSLPDAHPRVLSILY